MSEDALALSFNGLGWGWAGEVMIVVIFIPYLVYRNENLGDLHLYTQLGYEV